jgi:hypothetical protein
MSEIAPALAYSRPDSGGVRGGSSWVCCPASPRSGLARKAADLQNRSALDGYSILRMDRLG